MCIIFNSVCVINQNRYGLLGPSGCGKTTLLRLIVGRLKALSGSLRVFNADPYESMGSGSGTGIGYMPQVSSLHFLNFLNYQNKMYRN